MLYYRGLVISINDMLLGLRRLQKVPDEVRLQKIVEVLDEDRDGIIDASHVLKVILYTVKPAHAVTCIKRSSFSCPVIEHFVCIMN